MRKRLVGPQLRQIRRDHGHTQAEMAKRLKISSAYVNLLENNQRSLSVPVLMGLIEAYGIDMRDLSSDRDVDRLADLRAAVSDPSFARDKPDLQELRGAIEHAPRLVDLFLHLYRSHTRAVSHLSHVGETGSAEGLLQISPETALHDFFRDNRNHFEALERAAEEIRRQLGGTQDDLYALLKRYLRLERDIAVSLVSPEEMPDTLRSYDHKRRLVQLSQALDPPNRVFQLAHVIALTAIPETLDTLVAASGLDSPTARARCRVELANYFAAALLMPYQRFLERAESTGYDIDQIAASFDVTYEQVCHRLTTLQRDGARGVSFFLLRVDRAGNVTKRVNATAFALAEKGGACPVWNIHHAFDTPGVIVPQIVEMPDGAQFFTISRTSDRPVLGRHSQGNRLVIALGCARADAHRLGYSRTLNLAPDEPAGKIGINCHLCPRTACGQRAHQPLHMELPIDTNRRGRTRYES